MVVMRGKVGAVEWSVGKLMSIVLFMVVLAFAWIARYGSYKS